ncbi:hypothetical protein IAQ61_001712 [Plenodomus lingam]|uniref:uncharacterized protein n=1 Tax=Leptosphaeria maculans TaxID=5022 RepID=UPI00331F3BD7|nr:hypothetical protein IAQ61_001712 [Plenodomus lingam]
MWGNIPEGQCQDSGTSRAALGRLQTSVTLLEHDANFVQRAITAVPRPERGGISDPPTARSSDIAVVSASLATGHCRSLTVQEDSAE